MKYRFSVIFAGAGYEVYVGYSDRDASLRCVSQLVFIDVDDFGSQYKHYLSTGATDGGKIDITDGRKTSKKSKKCTVL